MASSAPSRSPRSRPFGRPPARRLAARALTERLRLYGRLISGNLTHADRGGIPDNAEFAAGWINRAAGLMDWLNQAA